MERPGDGPGGEKVTLVEKNFFVGVPEAVEYAGSLHAAGVAGASASLAAGYITTEPLYCNRFLRKGSGRKRIQ